MNSNQLPDHFRPVWENFPCVVTGVRTRAPALHFSCTDHHILSLRAFEHALELGYRRPALVLDGVIDHLVQGRFTAGVLIAQQAIPRSRRIEPFYDVTPARANPEIFHQWLRRKRPDAILTLYHVVLRWVNEAGFSVPDDIGLIQLERREDHPNWAGMHQHNDKVGEAAIEMVISMLHNNESGAPLFPRANLIGSTWISGSTVRSTVAGPSAP